MNRNLQNNVTNIMEKEKYSVSNIMEKENNDYKIM